MHILEMFQHHETFVQLTFGEKIVASLYVTLLGMGITFTALVLILAITSSMSKAVRRLEGKGKVKENKPSKAQMEIQSAVESVPLDLESDAGADEDEEALVALITAAIIAATGKTMVVHSIRRVEDPTPVWGKISRSEIMNSRI